MLIVKDFEKLEKHGFKKVSSWKSGDIWELILEKDENNNTISLLVNPLFTERAENEMFVYATTSESDQDDDEREDMDVSARIDIVFEMIADGTIEYIKENK